MNPLSTAVSGMQAAQTRLAVTANNIANAQTEGYRRDQVRAAAEASGGVRTQVDKLPEAGANLVADQVEQKAAAYAFDANLRTIKTMDTVAGSLLSARA
jgi:flagellar basal body rod protein FlgC